jgi:hypothetical protein
MGEVAFGTEEMKLIKRIKLDETILFANFFVVKNKWI